MADFFESFAPQTGEGWIEMAATLSERAKPYVAGFSELRDTPERLSLSFMGVSKGS